MTTNRDNQLSGTQPRAIHPSSLCPTDRPTASPSPLRAVCMYCKRTYRDGPTGAMGMVSHGICETCLAERHPEVAVEMAEERPPPELMQTHCRFCGCYIGDSYSEFATCAGCRESNERNSMEGKR